MLIQVEKRVVIIRHNGRILLEKPTGRTKVLLAKPVICNASAKNEEQEILIVLCVTEPVLIHDKVTRKTVLKTARIVPWKK